MENVLEAFITLFVIMDPVGNLPIFTSMTKGMPAIEVKRNVNRSVFVAGILLFVFLFLGIRIFDFFNIDLNSFQIAGGIVLLVLGIMYVLGIQYHFSKKAGNDLSVPFGTPLLTGPGVITTAIILVKEHGPYISAAAAFLTLLATWLILTNGYRLYKILGEQWTNVISRVMGIILAAVAVEFIAKGIISIVHSTL
ncbi:MarC family protein [Candidatus Woesearchaeota archaeon]|nr:MarC family protein [Candidatus Woesearchaeota archaeon]